MLSIFAFSGAYLLDGIRCPLKSGKPVLSKGTLLAPVSFFEQALCANVTVNDASIRITLGGKTLTAETGKTAYTVNGVSAEFAVAPRFEYSELVLPAVAIAKALGISARQFDQLAVFAEEAKLEALAADEKQLDDLARLTCGKYNAAYFTAEDFAAARDSWRRSLCGSEKDNDPAIPGMTELLRMRDEDSDMLRTQMHREPACPILWGDKPPVESADLKLQYDRIVRMAQPFGTFGCRGYRSPELLSDIVYAMDWMHDHMYGAELLSDSMYRSYRIFNWWEWYVGGADPMMDVVMIIENFISPEQKDKYLLPVDFIRTQSRTSLDASESMSRIITLIPLALLHNDRALLQADYVDMEKLLVEKDKGDCMRRDWCCMTHGMPYNICYGACNLARVAKVLQVLQGTPLEFTCRKKYNIMNMIRYTFSPVFYRGQGFSMMDGRFMQEASADLAVHLLGEFHNVYGLFGSEEDKELDEIIRRNAAPEIVRNLVSTYAQDITLKDYLNIHVEKVHTQMPKTNILAYGRYMHALTSPDIKPQPYTLGYMWYSGDSAVQHRRDNAFALRMSSCRTKNYESINGANADGWYTGDGMLYLYTPHDPEQYSTAWWENVNKHLMPGTTVDERIRVSEFYRDAWKSHQDFVGGVSMDGQFVTASMDLESFHNEVDLGIADDGYGRSLPIHHCTLTAKKSWFLFDRMALAMGTAVNAHDGYHVRTVIENRRLLPDMTDVRVNGECIPDDEFTITRDDVKTISIPFVAGYIFPCGGTITLQRYDVNGEKFLAMWLEHGIDPKDGSYVYAILPNANEEETQAYAAAPDFEILSNTDALHAVREKNSGLTGYVFREAASFDGITVEQPAIVMSRDAGEKREVRISDPTQKLQSYAFSVCGSEVLSADTAIAAETENGCIRGVVTCGPSLGAPYTMAIRK